MVKSHYTPMGFSARHGARLESDRFGDKSKKQIAMLNSGVGSLGGMSGDSRGLSTFVYPVEAIGFE